jgi:hypothetical protein
MQVSLFSLKLLAIVHVTSPFQGYPMGKCPRPPAHLLSNLRLFASIHLI